MYFIFYNYYQSSESYFFMGNVDMLTNIILYNTIMLYEDLLIVTAIEIQS